MRNKKIYDSVQSDLVFVTTKQFMEDFSHIVKADLAFQAGPASRWLSEQKSSYITSVIRGMAPSKYIFADVDCCLENAIKNEQKNDVDYFQPHKDKGTKYLNVDSNNRVINICEFVKGKVNIEFGTYLIDGIFHEIGQNNSTYRTIPTSLRNKFDNAKLWIEVYQNATRQQLSDLFRRLNDGKPLNEAEKRNACTSKVADVIRELSEIYAKNFVTKTWISQKEANRRGVDDFIASFAHVYYYGLATAINHQSLSDMYDTNDDDKVLKQGKEFNVDFHAFMKLFNKDLQVLHNKNSIFDLWVIFCEQKKKNCYLDDNKKNDYIKTYINVVCSLLLERDQFGRPVVYDAPTELRRGWGDPKSFETLVGGRQFANNIKRFELISQRMNLSNFFIQRDTKRSATPLQKTLTAYNKGWKTNTGEDIDKSKLHSNEYHTGHVKPHADGGKTELYNFVIQTKEDNLKLGKKPVVINPTV